MIRICAIMGAGDDSVCSRRAPASAHVLLEGKQAAVGAGYKAVFVVPHGCKGSATTNCACRSRTA